MELNRKSFVVVCKFVVVVQSLCHIQLFCDPMDGL